MVNLQLKLMFSHWTNIIVIYHHLLEVPTNHHNQHGFCQTQNRWCYVIFCRASIFGRFCENENTVMDFEYLRSLFSSNLNNFVKTSLNSLMLQKLLDLSSVFLCLWSIMENIYFFTKGLIKVPTSSPGVFQAMLSITSCYTCETFWWKDYST